jgi:hypothetical protein
MVRERLGWAEQLAQIKRMHQWVLAVEHILNGDFAQAGEAVTNETVGQSLDVWRQTHAAQLTKGHLSKLEQTCLSHFLQTLANQRLHLVQCYDQEGFPRTNNELERTIRALKTQYRRISGRKNWNSYLLRYGRCVAYAAWWEQDTDRQHQLEQRAAQLDRVRWREFRREVSAARSEQLKRFRFRHERQAYLSSLEARWAAATST